MSDTDLMPDTDLNHSSSDDGYLRVYRTSIKEAVGLVAMIPISTVLTVVRAIVNGGRV